MSENILSLNLEPSLYPRIHLSFRPWYYIPRFLILSNIRFHFNPLASWNWLPWDTLHVAEFSEFRELLEFKSKSAANALEPIVKQFIIDYECGKWQSETEIPVIS